MEKIEETIKEIALKHDIAIGRDDPILILHTINERLMRETATAQRQILQEFKEELESAAHEWDSTAKKTAEKILDVALAASKKALTEAGNKAAYTIAREVDSRLNLANALVRKARILNILNITAAIIVLIFAVTTVWVLKQQ